MTSSPPVTETIPAELKSLPQWVVWKLEPRGDGSGKPTKIPYDPRTGQKARADDPGSWRSFAQAVAAYETDAGYSGIGFELSADDPFFGVDLDGCIDPETGQLTPEALDIIRRLDSYTEVSPSGAGLRIFCRGALPDGRRRVGGIEMYDRGRFLTVTGNHLAGTPHTVEERGAEIAALHAALFPPVASARPLHVSASPLLTDGEVLDLCRAAANSVKFDALYRGDTTGYGSESEADLALCGLLAFYTQDAAQIDRIVSGSGLCREKWNQRPDYRQRTIQRALTALGDTYTPPAARSQTEAGHRNGRGPQPAFRENSADEPVFRESSADEPVFRESSAGAPHEPGAPPRSPWPSPPAEAAFHGLAGDIVRTIEPHTEADSVALLIQFLVAYGSAIGSAPWFQAEADRHGGNLFAVLVGISSKGRKGSSWGHVRGLFTEADPLWTANRVLSGLSSGEGLIHAVRDPLEKNERDKKTGETQTVIVDEGVTDKRLLVMESEFAAVLRQTQRDGNTLSATLRNAWDTGTLQSMTKNSPARATGAHVSIVGHITRDELRRDLTETESANGFGNRFLWLAVRRSKELPDGGNLYQDALTPLVCRLRAALTHARTTTQMARDDAARAIWHDVYHELSTGKAGLLGAMTGRAEAQTMRLALLYALLDGDSAIRADHLTAALALWEYCEASARFVFGDSLGDRVADEILRALRSAADGLSRSDLSAHLGRNVSSGRIGQALELLHEHGVVRRELRETGGRAAEIWLAS